MLASMAAMASSPSMTMSRVVAFLPHDNNLLLLLRAAHDKRKESRDGEQHAIHDAEGIARLQQVAGVFGPDDGVRREVDVPESVGGCGGAGLVADEAQLVDGADERADEAQVDEGDEVGVGARAVVREQRVDSPTGGEHGHDEQDEDIGRGEGIVLHVDVDEP